MCWCLWLIYTWRDWCNEWKTEKGHDCTNMGKVKGLELWWQLQVASLPERDIRNIRPLDFCWTECTKELHVFSSAVPRLTWTNENRCRVSTVLVNSSPVLIEGRSSCGAVHGCCHVCVTIWFLWRLLLWHVACGYGETENMLTNLHLSPLSIFLLIAQRSVYIITF